MRTALRGVTIIASCVLALAGCGNGEGTADAGGTRDAGAPRDSGTRRDAAPIDGGGESDTGPETDAGAGLAASWERQLFAPDAMASERLGVSVALSADGSRALVGAHWDDTVSGVDTGSAHVFVRSGASWTHEAVLLAPDAMAGDNFGVWVAVSGDGSRALVGARWDDTAGGADAGSAHVFVRSGTSWTHEAVLLAPDAMAEDAFGVSVALSPDGSRALVGAAADDTAGGVDTGSAHVFVRSGASWSHEAALLAPDAMAGDQFGYSVALSADASLVGAWQDDTAGGTDAGSAHVFVPSGTSWSHEAVLLAPDAMAGDFFGSSVGLSADGSRALVGAAADDTAGRVDTGSAHVFVPSGTSWSHEAVLLAPDAMAGDRFGVSVGLSADGSYALVGTWFDDTAGGVDAGSAHVFARSGASWSHEAVLLGRDAREGDGFGVAVALSADGGRALVGAHLDDTAGGADSGSAHVFALAP